MAEEKKPFKLLGVDFTSDKCLMSSFAYGAGGAFAIGCAYHLVINTLKIIQKSVTVSILNYRLPQETFTSFHMEPSRSASLEIGSSAGEGFRKTGKNQFKNEYTGFVTRAICKIKSHHV
jgi:hypothetical protein